MKLSKKMLVVALGMLVLPTSLAYGQSSDTYKQLLGADQVFSSQKVDVNKDGKSEVLVHYSISDETYLDLMVNNASVLHSDMGMVAEANRIKVTDIGKSGLVFENYVHQGGTAGPIIDVFHLKPDFTMVSVDSGADPKLTMDSKKNLIVSTDKLATKYQVTLPTSLKGQIPSTFSANDYYFKMYGNEYKYANGVAEVTFVYGTTLSVISNSTMPFEVHQTYALDKNQWILKKLSVKDPDKTGVKITEVKPSIAITAKPASKVTVDTLLADGKLPDGLIVGKSKEKDIKKIYGTPLETYPFEGRIAMLYKNRTFMVSDETSVLTMASYNEQGSILGLTANKSTAKNVKAVLGAKYNIGYDEEEGGAFTNIFNKSKTRFISISYGENDVVLSISIGIQ